MTKKKLRRDQPRDGESLVFLVDDICYAKEAQAVLVTPTMPSSLIDEKRILPGHAGKYTYAPWGPDNLLPQHVISNIERVEVVGTNANFNWKVCYGNGPRLEKLIYSDDPREIVTDDLGNIIGGKVVDRLQISSGKVFDWLSRCDVSLYMQEVLTDLSYFGNAFPMLLPEKERKGIYSIIHREAAFSRWGIDENGAIISHLYSAKWDENPGDDNIEESYVIDELDDILDIQTALTDKSITRMCYPLFMASPGRPYYSYPNWYSIFRSGWYEHLASIPSLKKAILQHNLGVKHIIYISPSYIEDKARQAGIDFSDQKALAELKTSLINEINDTLTGASNAGKALATLAKIIPSGNGTTVEKYFTIEKIDNNIQEGEYLTDYETGANVISYAMEVHPSLIGATPGKNSNSLSGSNQREIFMMKQALSRPMIDRAMRPFRAIKKINGWPSDYVITIPEYTFTTLDQAKSGKIESTNTEVK